MSPGIYLHLEYIVSKYELNVKTNVFIIKVYIVFIKRFERLFIKLQKEIVF